ncbi:MAG TPA: hypothetical protein VM734_25135 [Kofleriaceae bacterium]|jgi:hypothetical protein|nr:hypothetical protein [Kofleriaceae bacterium]
MLRSLWRPWAAGCVLIGLVACSPSKGGGGDGDGDGDGDGPNPPDRIDARRPDDPNLTWRQARLTNFTSYPEPGSEECQDFNGCKWAGHFAFVEGQQSESWVMSHNIAAVHSDDGDEFALKTLRVRFEDRSIDVTVYDMCSDSDCGGCCTRNASEVGFLIDLESYTAARFGVWDGIVEWACLDCD